MEFADLVQTGLCMMHKSCIFYLYIKYFQIKLVCIIVQAIYTHNRSLLDKEYNM